MSTKQLPFIFIFLFIAINIFTLKEGHNWGGDWGQYIIHAQNILEGKPYYQGIMLEKPVVYPPGFPLFIAPILKMTGVNFQLLKSINVLCWYLSILLLFFILKRTITRPQALLCTFLLSASSFFFVFKQNILSDIPFTFLVIATLWALEMGFLFPALFFMFGAILMRSAGVTLCIAGLFYFIFIKRNWLMSVGLIASSLAAISLQTFILGEVNPGFWHKFVSQPKDALLHLIQNASTVWQSIAWTLIPGETPITSLAFTIFEGLLIIISPLIYLGLAYLFIRKLIKKNLTLIETFCFFYIGLLLLWASNGDSPQNFARYSLPLIGLLLMFILQCANHFKKENWAKYFIIGLLSFNLVNMALLFNFNDDEVVHYPSNKKLFAWIKENVSPDEHYMTWEPRTVAVMTHRVGTSLWWFNLADPGFRQEMLRQWKVRFVILNPVGDKAAVDFLSQQPWASKAWELEGFYIIYKVQ